MALGSTLGLGRHLGGWVHLQEWPVKASARGKELWRQFGREANKKDGQKGSDESVRKERVRMDSKKRRLGRSLEKRILGRAPWLGGLPAGFMIGAPADLCAGACYQVIFHVPWTIGSV